MTFLVVAPASLALYTNYMKPLLYTLGVLALLVIGFFAFNSYIYHEKQADTDVPATTEEIKDTPVIIGENMDGEADPSMMNLGMKQWVWQYTTTKNGDKVMPKVPGKFTLTFEESGRFSVGTDCNSMGGEYTTEWNALTLSDMFSTMMYCEGSQEGEFAGYLSEVTQYELTSRGELILTMKDGAGTVTLR